MPKSFLLILTCYFPIQLCLAVDYEKYVLPVLMDNCIDCHGPDKPKARLRVDQRPVLLVGGDSGLPALVPGSPEKSHLIELIKLKDPDERMPRKGEPLSAAEIALLEKWITEGAVWPGQMEAKLELKTDHWAFQPVTRPPLPNKAQHPVDSFLHDRMARAGIKPNPPADGLSLLRRASIVLTGLPPEPDRVKQFLADFSKNQDRAYADLVDELLA